MSLGKKENLKKFQWISFLCMTVILLLAIGIITTVNLPQMSFPSIVNVIIGVVVMSGYCVLCLTCAMDRSVPDKSTLLFQCLIVIGFLGVLTDNFSWILDGSGRLIWVNHITIVQSFLLVAIVGPVFYSYQNALFPGGRPGFHKLLWGFAALDIFYILIASATGFLYTIDGSGNYAANVGILFFAIYPYAVLLYCILENLRRKIPVRQRIALLGFHLAFLLSGTVTIFVTDWAIWNVALFFDLMLMYGVVQMERSIELADQKAKLAEQSNTLVVQSRIMAEQSRELMEKQMQIMLSQIQPHFIYNTLGSISSLCMENPELAADLTDQFARYLQGNMSSLRNDHLIPFEKELEHTKTYLGIEKVRFSDYLHIVYHITCMDFFVPPLTLQPLVENAVKHGITPKEEGGTVIIDVKETPDCFVILVSDDGVGCDTEVPEDGKPHVGIANVRKRLELLCGGEVEMKSEVGVGTVVTVTIPKGEAL